MRVFRGLCGSIRGSRWCFNFVRGLEATGAVGLEAGGYTATDVRVVLFKAKRETWKAPLTQYAEAEAERWTRRIKSALEMNN